MTYYKLTLIVIIAILVTSASSTDRLKENETSYFNVEDKNKSDSRKTLSLSYGRRVSVAEVLDEEGDKFLPAFGYSYKIGFSQFPTKNLFGYNIELSFSSSQAYDKYNDPAQGYYSIGDIGIPLLVFNVPFTTTLDFTLSDMVKEQVNEYFGPIDTHFGVTLSGIRQSTVEHSYDADGDLVRHSALYLGAASGIIFGVRVFFLYPKVSLYTTARITGGYLYLASKDSDIFKQEGAVLNTSLDVGVNMYFW